MNNTAKDKQTLTVEEIKEAYYSLTGKASDIVRQLGLAGIALIWVFKTDLGQGKWQVPKDLILPSILIFIALAMDLLQYLVGSGVWLSVLYTNNKENQKDTDVIEVHRTITRPMEVLFWLKSAVMITAYVIILVYLARII